TAREQQKASLYSCTAAHVSIEPIVQVKVGPVALRNRLSIEYWNANIRAGDTVWYVGANDTVLSRSGWGLTNDLDLSFVTRFRLMVGVRYAVVQPLYRPGDYLPGEDATLNPNGHQRLGPIASYTFFDRHGARFDRPTLLLHVSWYLAHRFRTGA